MSGTKGTWQTVSASRLLWVTYAKRHYIFIMYTHDNDLLQKEIMTWRWSGVTHMSLGIGPSSLLSWSRIKVCFLSVWSCVRLLCWGAEEVPCARLGAVKGKNLSWNVVNKWDLTHKRHWWPINSTLACFQTQPSLSPNSWLISIHGIRRLFSPFPSPARQDASA